MIPEKENTVKLSDLKIAAARDPEAAYRRAGYLRELKKEGHNLTGFCPFHDDQHPSFKVRLDGDHAGTWRCFGCGEGGSIIDFYLRLHDLPELTPEAVADLAQALGVQSISDKPPRPKPRVTRRKVYPLLDAEGKLIAQHVRVERADGSKEFFWQRDGKPTLDGLPTADLPLYRPPSLADPPPGSTVILVEGEKAADALATQGVFAVGTVTGAGNPIPGDAALEFLRPYRVLLWPDADPAGAAHMGKIAARLVALGRAAPGIVNWPGAPPEGGDAADFTGTGEELQALLAAAREPTPEELQAPQEAPPTEEPHLTDSGNAERLVLQHGGNILYCWPWHKWLEWTGRVWQVDAEARVLQRAKATVRAMYREAGNLTDEDWRTKLAKHALTSESAQRRKAMVELAQSEPEVACDYTFFDTDSWLLNCLNGTIDLHTGNLQPHQREDNITKLAPVEYDPKATCPQWEEFLRGVFEGNTELIEFVQRAAGYSLTGDVSEDAMFFLHGSGANGKTTLFLTLQELLGAYAIQVSPGLLLTHYYETHPTGLVDLFGVRLAVSVEVGEGRRFDEERLKQVTGGDKIRARRMREDFWEFQATHKLWLAANEKPRVTGQDYAIWRRIKLIPFNVKFTEPGETGPDRNPSLRKNLFRDERPGILNWALVGCLSWQHEGLLPPPEVQAATAEYKQEEDTVERFIEAECLVAPGARETPAHLFKAYERWRKETGATKLTQTTFGSRLTKKGFISEVRREGEVTRRWRIGISLAEQPKFEYEE